VTEGRTPPSAGRPARTLVLALGNDVAGDDAIGLHAARQLRVRLGVAAASRCDISEPGATSDGSIDISEPGATSDGSVDIVETGEAGLALLDWVEGYDCLLILDSVCGDADSEGEVVSFGMSHLRPVSAPSPHYAGLPELERIARMCGLAFPERVRAVAMSILPPTHIREGLSETVAQALPRMLDSAESVLREWGRLEGARHGVTKSRGHEDP